MKLFPLTEDIKKKINSATPSLYELDGFFDADDEMQMIAEYIKENSLHNQEVSPKRIKFLYSNKPTKDGGRFILTNLFVRSEMEKMVNDKYDYILTVFYSVWKDLTPEQKIMSLDKALCGIDVGDMEHQKISKKKPDSKEYTENMNLFGPLEVMKLSEMIDLKCQSFIEEKNEEKNNNKKKKAKASE